MFKFLFLHGFTASGDCGAAHTLQTLLQGKAQMICPDLPLHPQQTIRFLQDLCDVEKPDLIIGTSCGGGYGLYLAGLCGIPAILSNPHLEMPSFLIPRKGEMKYVSPRKDGATGFVVDDQLIAEFEDFQAHQFDLYNPYYKDKVWGMFGSKDVIAHCEPLFSQYYSTAIHYDGAHLMSDDDIRNSIMPVIEKWMAQHEGNGQQKRKFRHFKGGEYEMQYVALDSESQERMVVYRALYGERRYWVRPEKMFFGWVEKDGKRMPRFEEHG